MRRILGCCALLLTVGCTADPTAGPEPPSPGATPTTAAPSAEPEEPTTRPLVIAVNARRPPLALTEAQARRIIRRDDDRRKVVERTDRLDHLPMDAVAVVVADAVGPSVRVATVDGIDPLREPDAYPIQVVGPAHAEVTTLTVVGDVMLGRQVTGMPALRPMSDRLASADITVGNLEGTLSDAGAPTQGGDSFHAPPSVRRQLRAAGFDALGLANNHLGDYGDEALTDTVRLLRSGGLPTFGAGRDRAQASEPVVVRRGGVSFGFVGFNAIGETPEAGADQPGALSVSMPPRTGPLDRAELRAVLDDVRRLARQVDVVTVLPHWGTQYTYRPEPVQGRVARALVRAGADLVVGGHPHWVQGADLVDGALVVNSLGNFVFDMDTPETNEGLVLEAVFWGDRLMSADFVPYRIGADFAPRVVSYDRSGRVREGFWELSSLAATR